MEDLKLFTVDAFTKERFYGNPAAVCPDVTNKGLSVETMQKLAAEMNLSETAFIRTVFPDDSMSTGSRFSLRWFTPLTEIKMCGHATLASAYVLFEKMDNRCSTITFETLSGDLRVTKDGGYLQMDFPTSETIDQKITDYETLLKLLFGGSSNVEQIVLCPSLQYLVIHLKDGWSRAEFERWSPPIDSLLSVDSGGKFLLVCVTMKGLPGRGFENSTGQAYDFVSRSFAPWTGVPEDPVTGSAHTVLVHYWSERLGQQDFYARQCSKRGGDVWVNRVGDRTILRGQAVLVLESKLYLD